MSQSIKAAADRVAPWRRADWRILIVEGVVLILAGVYLLADGERAESILGLVVGAALLGDGIRQWFLGYRRLDRGRTRDLTLTRGSVGIATGGLVLALSLLQQITVVGIRIGIGVGGLAYGLLGLLLILPAIRNRQLRVTAAVYDLLLVLVSLLLLYRVATNDSIAGLLTVTSWLLVGTGIVIVIVGVMRRPRTDKVPPA
jgi:uncharacterized membrane protein HdeD (DUF308 family)